MSNTRTLKALGMVAFLAGFLGMNARAGFGESPLGYMTVWDADAAGNKGGWLWGSSWGVGDLQAITTDDVHFELMPNIGQYAFGAGQVGVNAGDVAYWTNSDDGGVTAGPDGNKWMEALCYFEQYPLTANETNAILTFDVEAFDLDERYSAIGFIKVLNPNNDWAVSTSTSVAITNTGSYSLSLTLSDNFNNFEGMDLQAGWAMEGINANPDDDWGSVTITLTSLVAQDNDREAPSPDPAQFFTAPYATSDSAISMTAVTATDINGVEYYFTCTAGGGSDSGWQSSTNYTDTGLSIDSEYAYTVTVRDKSSQANTTAASAELSARTLGGDFSAPLPDPAEIESAIASPVTIKLTAVTATDESAVEYYFDCIAGAGNDSGWQSSPVYVDTGLNPGSNYTYTVTVRDLSSSMNTTEASAPLAVSTLYLPGSYSLTNSLQGFSGDNTQDLIVHELAVAGFELASRDAGQLVSFDASGATFGDEATWGSRNTLRTLAQDYGDADFEVYATFITANTTEQAGFIGVGQGIIGNWGVPDFELVGVNAISAEMQGNWCKVFTFVDGVLDPLTESESIASSTNRVRMIHDATAETIRFELDTDYAGGEFAADRVLGTHSTTNVWEDMPQRIYLAAGAGVLWKDVAIIADSAPIVPVDQVVIIPAESGVTLQWSSAAGQTYDVYYTTDLRGGGSWSVDPSAGCSDITGTGGSISATSTLGAPAAFYKVGTE